MNKQAVLVFNPKSGKGKATIRARDFADHWKDRTGNELMLRPTRSLEDIRIAARETLNQGDVQIFMGGDGTLLESLQGLAEQYNFQPLEKPIGLLPGGTGNSFLRDFDITSYEQARDALLNALTKEEIIPIDTALIRYNRVQTQVPSEPGEKATRIMFNIFGVGIISDITTSAIKMRHIGEMNYQVASLYKLVGHKMYKCRVRLNNRDWEDLDFNLITVSNSRFTGGAMEIAPDVRVNDGKMFYLRSAIKSRIKLLKVFPKLFKGGVTNMPNIYTELIQSINLNHSRPFVMNVDGELDHGWNPGLDINKGYFKLYMPLSLLKQ